MFNHDAFEASSRNQVCGEIVGLRFSWDTFAGSFGNISMFFRLFIFKHNLGWLKMWILNYFARNLLMGTQNKGNGLLKRCVF